ncbi:MAG TPA: DUF47 family protein [Acidimicrobiales bacterium]|jgi:hypothetical protein|nr:DUF47 family protein [Acidimicrobiales bacterium]
MPASIDRARFRADIDHSIVLLFTLVSEALSRATTALLDQDVELAEVVVEGDRAIDERCEALIGMVREGLAEVAADPEALEALIDILQMVPELERSADLAEHIARRTRDGLGGVITAQSRGLIQQMGDVAIRMWQTATVAYREHSRDAGIALSGADDHLDELAASLVAHGSLGSDAKLAMDLALIARFYERLGDHAVNLARRIDTMAAPRRLSTVQFFATHASSRISTIAASPSKNGGILGRIRRLRLGPTDERFFDLFQAAAANARDGADELNKLMASFSDIDERCDRIKSLEHRGDQITIEILRRLDASFVTPFDREDIHALTEALDDVIDHIFSAASLIDLAKLTEPLPELAEQTAVLVAMVDELEDLMQSLRTRAGARHRLERIEHLERQGDAIFRQSLVRLFSGEYAALDVIVWKDIVQAIEDSLNSVEDVSDVIESILVKNS